MAQIVIAGGGFAGLSASLFLARRGHAVTVIERDGAPTGATPDDDADGWPRPGAPQAHQSHVLLGRGRKVLQQEAPDVLDALLARGVREQDAAVGAGSVPGAAMLLGRRLVSEAVLRRAVDQEPGVTVRSPDAVTGLVASPGPVPLVTGVRTERGDAIPADLVLDAGGRRSALPSWLAELGTRPPVDEVHPLGFFYTTRFYRLRPGAEAPMMRVPGAAALDYANVLAFRGDNDTFSLTTTMSVQDPLRKALRDPEIHRRFLEAVPLTAPWLAVSDPISEIFTMARIENRRRRLVDEDGPIVAGLVALGDAALHTNPTLGRGLSMGLWHAQALADRVDDATAEPLAFAASFDDWTQSTLGIWFDTQVANDAGILERLEAGLRGERLPTPDSARFVAAALALAQTDPVVGQALAEMVHLLTPPAEALGRPDVAQRVAAFLATQPDLDRPPDTPNRAVLERLVSTPVSGATSRVTALPDSSDGR